MTENEIDEFVAMSARISAEPAENIDLFKTMIDGVFAGFENMNMSWMFSAAHEMENGNQSGGFRVKEPRGLADLLGRLGIKVGHEDGEESLSAFIQAIKACAETLEEMIKEGRFKDD